MRSPLSHTQPVKSYNIYNPMKLELPPSIFSSIFKKNSVYKNKSCKNEKVEICRMFGKNLTKTRFFANLNLRNFVYAPTLADRCKTSLVYTEYILVYMYTNTFPLLSLSLSPSPPLPHSPTLSPLAPSPSLFFYRSSGSIFHPLLGFLFHMRERFLFPIYFF